MRPILFALTLLALARILYPQATVKQIKAAKELRCGLVTEEPEYSNLDAHGNRAAFDIDLCKATAVALLGSNARFTMTPYPDENEGLKALQDGKVDLLPTASPTLTNRASFAFGLPVLFDFQGFLVNKTLGIKSPQDLAGQKVCYLVETGMETNILAYMQRRGIKFFPFPFQEEGEMEAAFITNNCVALSADVTQLAFERIAFRSMAKNFEILPEVIARDPLAPATRLGDAGWTNLVAAVRDALLEAEALGVTQSSVAQQAKSPDTAIQYLLGVSFGIGKPLGLDDGWAARMLQAVGNYAEIFDRDLGVGSPMRLDRGPSRLDTALPVPGLLYANPLR